MMRVLALAFVAVWTGGMYPAPMDSPDRRGRIYPALQKFEVASIKPCSEESLPPAGPGGRGAGPANATTSPGHAHWECVTLDQLITTAYASGRDNLLLNSTNQQRPGEPKPVRGGPSWVYSDKWAVDAKAAGDAERATMIGPMLRALLEDRFKAKTHRATEERSMYALTVAKGGARIKPSTPGDCQQFDASAPPVPQPGQLPVCGSLNMNWNSGNRTLTFAGTTLEDFARNMSSGVMDRFVVDKTGLDGKFNIPLEFAPDDSTPGGLGGLAWSKRDGAPPPTAGSIFKALEGLGLKLEAVKAQAEYLVIDQVERPKPDLSSPFHVVPAAFLQTKSVKPRYDVASIKPCPPTDGPLTGGARGTAGGTNAAFSPGRFSVPCVTLEQLIYLAYASYGAAEDQLLANDYLGTASDATKIKGGPSWVHSNNDRYAIEATAPGVSDRATLMGAMLRTLLEERFKLVMHRDTEDQPMYALRIAKGGLKLQPMKDSDCAQDPGPPPWATPPCGFMTNGHRAQNARWQYVGFELKFLARQLAAVVGHHVIDETGTTAKFTIKLDFLDDRVPAPPDGAEAVTPVPSIFTALEQQLGLKLEKTTGKHGFIVIDHIERPTPDPPSPSAPLGRGFGAASSVDRWISYWYNLYHDKTY